VFRALRHMHGLCFGMRTASVWRQALTKGQARDAAFRTIPDGPLVLRNAINRTFGSSAVIE